VRVKKGEEQSQVWGFKPTGRKKKRGKQGSQPSPSLLPYREEKRCILIRRSIAAPRGKKEGVGVKTTRRGFCTTNLQTGRKKKDGNILSKRGETLPAWRKEKKEKEKKEPTTTRFHRK